MLSALSIRDFILIDQLTLELEPGLNVLTGETGAGKSILLDALQFVLGARSDRGVVRVQAQQAIVSAVFEPPETHPIRKVLSENGFDADGPIIFRRQLGADGRARAFINDQPASAGLLRAAGDLVLEIHGQHDDRGMLDPQSHRRLVDQFRGLSGDVQALNLGYEALKAAEHAETEARAAFAAAERDRDYLQHAVDELSTFVARDGEEADLASERSRLQAAEKISGDLNEAVEALGGAQGAEAKLNLAFRRLGRAQSAAHGALDTAFQQIERALIETSEARQALDRAMRPLTLDPKRLESIESRLFSLRGLARKYGVLPDRLPARLEDMARDLQRIENGGAALKELAANVERARASYQRGAKALSEKRKAAAEALDAAVARELKPLKLETARFMTEHTHLPMDQAGPEGCDRIIFAVATNPGQPAGALTRIASGGELARFILAIKVALAGAGQAGTLIFDEVDRGIGGAVADAVGERLAMLARGAQVLVVTHSPQVAARAAHHWHVSKAIQAGETRTLLKKLDAPNRQEEIARMLSGAAVTQEARNAAKSLLESALSATAPAAVVKRGRR